MKKLFKHIVIALLLINLCSCSAALPEQTGAGAEQETTAAVPATAPVSEGKQAVSLINDGGAVVQERIKVPEGFVRIDAEENSFGRFLRTLPLKPHGSKVKLYNGDTRDTDYHAAILDMDVGDRDLQQCADAVMRLRAEYLYKQQDFDRIHFNFTNGFRADFTKWMAGYSIKVNNNDVRWVENPASSNEYGSFRSYLNMVFSYAGTLSLSKELKEVPLDEMEIGDVFIEGGSPGHAVVVLDMAVNAGTGDKIFLLAQSYMPAQDIHILRNLENDEISPWYSAKIDKTLRTPQWNFDKNLLKRFTD